MFHRAQNAKEFYLTRVIDLLVIGKAQERLKIKTLSL